MAENNGSKVGAYLKEHWFALLITAVVIALVVQNLVMIEAPAQLGLLFTTVTLPSWLFLLVAFIAGGIAGWFFRKKKREKPKE